MFYNPQQLKLGTMPLVAANWNQEGNHQKVDLSNGSTMKLPPCQLVCAKRPPSWMQEQNH